MQEKAIEGAAADNAEADKMWNFTVQLIDAADKKSAESKTTIQSNPQEESVDESPAAEEAGAMGDGEDKKSK